MIWKHLTTIDQLTEIDTLSKERSVLIFKHSTRCSISHAALGRFERNWENEKSPLLEVYYLDLLQHRDVSDAIATRYALEHQSPQALIIRNGKCVFSQTHSGIRLEDLLAI